MPFPATDRVIYGKNPLDAVICQLRFPTVLRIDSQPPSEFQDAIRESFPEYSERTETATVELSSSARPGVPPQLLGQLVQTSVTKNHTFVSADGEWTVNLTRDFLALTAQKYLRWEEFKERLELPIGALVENYSPPYFSRIGLRYVDVIRRSSVGLTGVPWRELLQPPIAGFAGCDEEISGAIGVLNSTHELRLEEYSGRVRIAAGLAKSDEGGEPDFAIDSDFFTTSRTSLGGELPVLNYFNRNASRLFRWAITDRLHQAMEPRDL